MRLQKFLNEGILKVGLKKYADVLNSLEDIIMDNPDDVVDILNKSFKQLYVAFSSTNITKMKTEFIQSAYASATKGWIIIAINTKICLKVLKNDGFEVFKDDILSILVHESTHMKQYERMKIIKSSDLEITDDKHELMAYANQTVFEILNSGQYGSLWDVLDLLKNVKDVPSETYYAVKKILHKNGMNQYLKYIYMYIDDILDNMKKDI